MQRTLEVWEATGILSWRINADALSQSEGVRSEARSRLPLVQRVMAGNAHAARVAAELILSVPALATISTIVCMSNRRGSSSNRKQQHGCYHIPIKHCVLSM